ncbi:MAG: ribulose-phosphate 3-epimerase [Solirubrobacteraceae bacterium]
MAGNRSGDGSSEASLPAARELGASTRGGHVRARPSAFGAIVVGALADLVHGAGHFDVHLMIERPERQIAEIARAGADNITIHVEATPHVHYALQAIREEGCSAAAALHPVTPASALDEATGDMLDLALCMSVNPGWGAQELIPASIGKLERMRSALPDGVALEVDGGVHRGTAGAVANAGANVLVAGAAVFTSDDPAATYAEIVAAAGP